MPPKSTSDSAASNRKSSREIKPAGPPKPSSAQSEAAPKGKAKAKAPPKAAASKRKAKVGEENEDEEEEEEEEEEKPKAKKPKAAPKKAPAKKAAPAATSQELAGKIFIFTGKLSHMTRDQASSYVTTKGGKVAKSVSKGTKLTHAVLGEDVGAVKMNEIQERDIEVMNEKEFMDLVGFKLERDVDEDEDDEGENGEGSSSPKK